MTPPLPYLWRLVVEGLSLCYRAAPGFEVRLTPQASLILSGLATTALIAAAAPRRKDLRFIGEFWRSMELQASETPLLSIAIPGVLTMHSSLSKARGTR